MTSTWLFVACAFAAIVCAVISGVFLTFSDFVMRSPDRAPPAAGVEVMQVINREVFRSLFMVLLLGMSALAPLSIGYAGLRLAGPAAALIATGGGLYLVGVFGVTAVANVPMNKRLAGLAGAGPEAAAYWAETYLPRWTFWNSVRALASAAAAVCFLLAGAAMARAMVASGG